VKRLLLIFAVVSLMGTLFVAGCGEEAATTTSASGAQSTTTISGSTGSTEGASTTESTVAEATPQSGGVLKILSAAGSPANLSYLGGSSNPQDSRYASPAGETLIGKDGEGNYYPLLATSYEVAADGKSITFILRQGVKFHDGTDFNAEAAKFCLDMAIKGEMPELPTMLTSVDVVDPYTIRLNIPSFDWGLLDTIAMSPVCMMISPTSLKENPKEWAYTHIVGTGPFKLVEYVPDTSITYERFDDYWQEGKPYLDGVEFDLMADYTTALLALQSGQAQVMYQTEAKDVADLKDAGFEAQVGPQGNTWTFFFDSRNPKSPFSDVRVRQAFCYAIDTKALLEIGHGLYEATNQPYAPEFWPNNPDVVGYPYDVQKAKDLLAEAGYADGFDTTLNMIAGRADDLQLAIQGYLLEVGIRAQINKITAPDFIQKYVFNGWDGVINLYSGTWPRCPSLVERGATVNVNPKAGAISSAQFDDLLTTFLAANAEPDFDKSKVMYQQLWKSMVDEHCTNFFAYYAPDISCYAPAVHDMGLSNVWFTLADCWLEQ
jgi:peptide/nickel transport system substrate-binding protein